MTIEEVTAIVDGQRVVYRRGDTYIYAKPSLGGASQSEKVVITQIYADTGHIRAVYALQGTNYTDGCRLENLRPLSPLEQLAECGEQQP